MPHTLTGLLVGWTLWMSCRACHRYATGYMYHCRGSGWESKSLWVAPL